MRVVLDTNILVVSITSSSPYHKIFTSLLNKQYDLIVSTSIVFEYREIIQERYGEKTATLLVELLDELSNVHYVNPSFRWNFITVDSDDNKFVDCAIAGYAEFIVTEDKHFNVLKEIEFPKVSVINIEDFMRVLQ
jgi:uncharacterized protein